jgi:hypothetical protein
MRLQLTFEAFNQWNYDTVNTDFNAFAENQSNNWRRREARGQKSLFAK